MANNYVDAVFLGYTYSENDEQVNFSKSFTKGLYIDCTNKVEGFFTSTIQEGKKTRLSPFLQLFGFGPILQNEKTRLDKKLDLYEDNLKLDKTQKEEFENKLYLKLYIEFSETSGVKKDIFSFIRNYAYVKIEDDKIVDSVQDKEEDNKNPFLVPPEDSKKEKSSESPSVEGEKGVIETALDWVKKIASFASLPEEKVKTATKFIKENPEITGALATIILPRIYDALTGKKVDLSLTSLGISGAQGAIIAAALSYFLGDKAPNIGGSSSSGGGIPNVFTAGANLLGIDTNDYIVYDGGSTRDEQTAQFQRCLIRLGGGNLEAEKRNIQEPAYKPIIGVKVPGKKNYADDGRFGKWTLNASTSLFATINKLNAEQIKKDPSLEIKNPEKVPLAVITSTACIGKTDANSSPQEKKQADEMKPLSESKLYTDFSFLSTKNAKLHSVLMEQLKKDLKRG